jgi:hypothetical protein
MANEDWSDRELDPGAKAVDREIDRLKRVYAQHAETLSTLATSAPTKALARRYGDLIGEINRSILALDDPGAMIPRGTAERPIDPEPRATPPVVQPPRPATPSVSEVKLRTEPGTSMISAEPESGVFGRIVLILAMALILIGALAFLVWKFSGESQAPAPPPAVVEVPEPALVPEPPLRATPEAQDFGVVLKGTRVARTFEVANNTDRDVTIEIERSKCRCLWFDYPRVIPARGRIVVSVAVDGGRAETGLVSEAIVIATKHEPRVATEVQVTAQVR